jgi:hypothetical protein
VSSASEFVAEPQNRVYVSIEEEDGLLIGGGLAGWTRLGVLGEAQSSIASGTAAAHGKRELRQVRKSAKVCESLGNPATE